MKSGALTTDFIADLEERPASGDSGCGVNR
jgi:hypothetical protein